MGSLLKALRYSAVGITIVGIFSSIAGCSAGDSIRALIMVFIMMLLGGTGQDDISKITITSGSGVVITSGAVGEPVTFTIPHHQLPVDRISSPQPASHTIATCAWDMGDGTILFGETVIHTYQSAGKYFVTITCESEGGSQVLLSFSFPIEDGGGSPAPATPFTIGTEPSASATFPAPLSEQSAFMTLVAPSSGSGTIATVKLGLSTAAVNTGNYKVFIARTISGATFETVAVDTVTASDDACPITGSFRTCTFSVSLDGAQAGDFIGFYRPSGEPEINLLVELNPGQAIGNAAPIADINPSDTLPLTFNFAGPMALFGSQP